MKKTFLFQLLLATTGLILAGCVSAPKKIPPSVAPLNAKKEMSQVQADLASGNDKRALARLRNLVAKHPRSDVADEATLQMAGIYLKQNQFETAYKTYISLVESDVLSPNEAEALLGASKALFRMGRMDEALALTVRGLNIPGLVDSKRLEFMRHRYALNTTMGDRVDALQALAFIFQKDEKTDVRTQVQARVQEILSSNLKEPDLERVVGDSSFGFVRPQAALLLAQMKLQNKEFDRARSLFSKAADWGQGTPLQAQAETYRNQLDARRNVDPYTVGAVLPMTGKYATVARKTLNGLQMGLGIYGGDSPSQFKLAIVDSEGTPDGARRAVDRLVTEDNVIAIVGSLLSKTASSVATKAEEMGVPSIALSQKSGLTESGSYIFRNAVTSEMQVKELVRLSMDQLGLKRFAILYPNEPYGVEYANLFWDEVLARGGTISGAQPYSPTETDFRGPIKRLVGTYYLDDRRAEYQSRVRDWFKKQKKITTRLSPPDDLLPPIVDFDAVFIPDSPKAIGQAAPMLAYQGVGNIRLLGTNVWNSTDLIRRGQKNVDRAVFVDTNLDNDPAFKNSKFFREYQKIFGETPGLFEAQGFEVGLMLRQTIASGERTRSGLARALLEVQQVQGVTGPLAMNSQRELVRSLTPFMVKQNEIVAWSPEVENSVTAQKKEKDKTKR